LSSFNGRSNCNDFSLGVELEGCDKDDFEKVQYQVLVDLVKQLQGYFPAITTDRVVGHEHIAPGRKTDPGPFFAWQKFREELESA
jgi:AmpD protein